LASSCRLTQISHHLLPPPLWMNQSEALACPMPSCLMAAVSC
jgi:hypothetical protein